MTSPMNTGIYAHRQALFSLKGSKCARRGGGTFWREAPQAATQSLAKHWLLNALPFLIARLCHAISVFIAERYSGRLKNRDKMHVRIGRILASHPQVADLYEVAVKEASGQLSIEWSAKDGQRQWREIREGAYLLRTNLTATTASELWAKYMQLTEVEAAFRASKSELSIRPLFHQLERRVKAHVMVGFLGYALWVTLKHLLRRKQSEWSATRALAELATLQSADIVLPTTDGREIRLRRITEPTAMQQRLLNQLAIDLPDQLQINQQCSADFAVA